MSSYEFYDCFLDNQGLYCLILIFTLILYWRIYRKFIFSFIDPLFLSSIYSLFGFSVVLFLFVLNNISQYYFCSFLLTQISFWIGLYCFKNKTIAISMSFLKIRNESHLLKCVFFVSFVLYISTTLLGYLVLGVPILFSSRLDVNANAQGGMGVLSRFSHLSIICLYCAFTYMLQRSKDTIVKILAYLSIFMFVVFSILSGSKSSFMLMASVLFCFIIVNRNENEKKFKKLNRWQYYFLFAGTIMALLTILITIDGNVFNSITTLLFRLVGSGDIYWMGYPNGALEQVPYRNPFIVCFQSFLGFFRIVDHSNFPEPIGYTLSSFYTEKTSLTGGNARHNIFGYIYFGVYFSVFFSFILGFLIAFIRKFLFSIKKQGHICKLFAVLLYIKVVTLETDPTLYFSYLTDIFIVIPVVLLLSFLLYYTNYVQNRNFISYIQ